MAAILKWLPQPPAVTSGWGPVLKSTVMGYSNCVPSLLLVSQSARTFAQATGLLVLSYVSIKLIVCQVGDEVEF